MANREPGGARDGREQRNTDGGRLLHQFVACATGHDEHAGAGIGAGTGQRANHLVERVVAPDILAHDHELAAGGGPRGGVHRPRLAIERLARLQRLAGTKERRSRHLQRRRDRPRGAHGGVDRLDAAEAAAAAPRDRACALGELLRAPLRNGDPQLDAAAVMLDHDRADLTSVRDFLAHRETDGEILEVGRRAHHDDVRLAAVDERDRHFLGDHRWLDAGSALAQHDDMLRSRRRGVADPRHWSGTTGRRPLASRHARTRRVTATPWAARSATRSAP